MSRRPTGRTRGIGPRLLRLGGRVRAWIFRVPVEEEVEEEMAFHLRMRVEEYLSKGMSEEEAHQRALGGFGNLDHLKERLERLGQKREGRMRRASWWDEIRQDGKQALRQMVRKPGFAGVAVLTLALAMGANTAVFSVVNGVLLRPLPYRDPGELVALWTRYLPSSGLDIPQFQLSPPEVLDYRDESRAMRGVAPYSLGSVVLTGDGAAPERLGTVGAGKGLFPLLGVQPARGRSFTDQETESGARLAILSHDLWVRRFGGDPDVVGRAIELNGLVYSVIGVMPPEFVFPTAATALWLPLGLDEKNPGSRGGHYLQAVGRLAPGVSLEEADAELETITAGWNELYQHHAMGHFIFLRPLAEDLAGDARTPLLLLGVAVVLVLLIACGNVANLFLTRGESRRGEMAVRTALGAGRPRLARQLLVEGMMISVAGALGGLALAWIGVPALLAIDPTALPRSEGVRVNGTVLAFTGLLVVLATLAFGLAPAMVRQQPSAAQGRGWTAGRGLALRRFLVGGEVALGLLVILSAALLTRSLKNLQAVDPGLRSEGLLTFGLSLPSASYPDVGEVRLFYDELLDRLRALPRVQAASAVSNLPLTGSAGLSDFLPEGEAPPGDGVPKWNAQVVSVRPDYFETVGIPLREGRFIDETDGPEGFPVAVLNEAAVRRYFAEASPVGRRITFDWPDPTWITVVGVVGDTRHDPREEPRPVIYLNHRQLGAADFGTGRSMTVLARVTDEPERLSPQLRQAVAELDPKLAISNLRTFQEVEARSLARPRLTADLLGAFAVLALFLAIIGVYGVVSYSAARRTREIALRLALGAGRGQVTALVVADGARPVILGGGVGVALALATARVLRNLLFGIGPTDPVVFVAVPAVLLAVALAATWWPARRATRVEPASALRQE